MTDASPDTSSAAKEPTLAERLDAVLARLGTSRTELIEQLMARLERAGEAYESATIPADKDIWHAEGMRLAAALHAAL